MGRIASLISWELNEHIRVLVAVTGVLTVGLIFQRGILVSMAEVTSNPGYVDGLESVSGHVIVRAVTSPGLWVVVSFFIALLVALVFRAGIEGGYGLTVYSLPYSKLEIFSMKLVSSVLLSFTVVLLPIFVLIPLNFADTPGFAASLLLGRHFIELTAVLVIAILYILSTTLFLSVLSRNMLATLVVAFPILTIPYLINANLPPRGFFNVAVMDALFGQYTSFGRLLTNSTIISFGILVPALLIAFSLLLTLRRDVR